MEGLNLNNILDESDIETLFTDEPEKDDTPPKDKESDEPDDSDKEQKDTIEVDSNNLFDEPEGVDSEENNEEKEDAPDDLKGGTSPNFYSSIANALKEEGIFPDLEEDIISNVKEPEDFRDLIEQQIQAGLTERQKKIDEALNAGIEPSEVRKYEATLNYLHNITDETLSDEDDEGENLRRNLIYQDFINRGYSKERAEREVKKSFDAGSDIEDAKEALSSNIEFFQVNYNNLIKEAKQAQDEIIKEREAQAEKLKTSILEDKNVFGDLNVDKSTRRKIFENLSKPIYKDPDTGVYYTAIQKYEKENRIEFLKNVSLIYTLTNGFKNIDGLIKGKVNKEVKKGLRDLENRINNTSRNSDGTLNFVGGKDKDSYFSGLSLDI